MQLREKKRLAWRQQKLIVSKHIYCMSFDELYDDLLFRLNKYQFAAEDDYKITPATVVSCRFHARG